MFSESYTALMPSPSTLTGLPLETTFTLTVPILLLENAATEMTCFFSVVDACNEIRFRSVEPRNKSTVPHVGHFVTSSAIRRA